MENLFAKIKKDTLKPEEKSQILSSIEAFMHENPVKQIKSPFYSMYSLYRNKTLVVTMTILLVFVISTSGTISASSSSLPGDILYPIKILNENIQSLFTFGSQALAKLESVHAISRLQEAEKLALEGKLSTATRQEIESKFVAQTNETIKNINELKQSGNPTEALKVTNDFQKSLADNETAITQLISHSDTKTETKQELSSIVSNVQTQLQKTSNIDDVSATSITATSTNATSTNPLFELNTSTSTESIDTNFNQSGNASSSLRRATNAPLDNATTTQIKSKFNSFLRRIMGK